jgi:TatD DNase family protein
MTLFDVALPPPADLHCHVANAGGYASMTPNSLILAVTNDPASWKAMSTGRVPRNVTWAVGLHPCELRDDDDRLEDLIASVAAADAIGEVGLDYSRRAHGSRVAQRRALGRILATDAAHDKLVTLHSVAATGDIVAALRDHPVAGAVLHWFLGSAADVDAAIELDAFYSVNASMMRSPRGRAAIAEMPPNRVLAETDAPFAQHRSKQTVPGDVDSVERDLARLWSVDPSEVRHRLWHNLSALQSRLNVPPFPAARR